MGRPQKLTLDFFIHDAHASDDRKIIRLRKKHGNDGYATYFNLLEQCCQEPGMKVNLKDPEEAEIAADRFFLRDCQHLYSVIQFCADIGLLNKQLWESERQVFSDAFHARYIDRLEKRKADAKRKRQSRAVKALQGKIDSLESGLSSVTSELSANVTNGRPTTEDQKTEVQSTEVKDQKTEAHKIEPCVVEQENPLLKIEDRWAARKQNRKDSPFDLAWTQYQRNCIVVDRSPGSRTQASLAWAERFPDGPTPEFLESLDVYWQQQLEKFQLGQQCVGVVGMLRFITEPEHAEQAISRQQLLAQAPQIADPKTFAEATKAKAEDDMWAAIKAKGGAA